MGGTTKPIRHRLMLRRFIFVLDELAKAKPRGLTVDEVASRVAARTAQNWHRRTIMRDLETAEALGLATVTPVGLRGEAWRWFFESYVPDDNPEPTLDDGLDDIFPRI